MNHFLLMCPYVTSLDWRFRSGSQSYASISPGSDCTHQHPGPRSRCVPSVSGLVVFLRIAGRIGTGTCEQRNLRSALGGFPQRAGRGAGHGRTLFSLWNGLGERVHGGVSDSMSLSSLGIRNRWALHPHSSWGSNSGICPAAVLSQR